MTSDPIGDINDAQGRELVDSDGQPLGQIRQIFLDETTSRPAWAAVDAPGEGGELVLAPLAHSTREGDAVRVAVSRQRVETSPSTSGLTERFSPEHMDRVRAHYADQTADADLSARGDTTLSGGRDDTAVPAGREGDTSVTGDLPPEMIRSEEALFVEHERVPRERVRLVKRIVTETVTQTVEVRREELHLERVAISGQGDGANDADSPVAGSAAGMGAGEGTSGMDASAGGSHAGGIGSGARRPGEQETTTGGGGGLSALLARASSLVGKACERFGGGQGFGEAFTTETLDLTLYEEQVVVSKRIVPRERVRIHREVVTEPQRISDELRKERIEMERIGLDAETRVEGGQRPEASL